MKQQICTKTFYQPMGKVETTAIPCSFLICAKPEKHHCHTCSLLICAKPENSTATSSSKFKI